MDQDTPLQRTLKIGKASVGLIHLDTALSKVLKDNSLNEEQAVAYLFKQVNKHNYVPPTAHKLYKDALKQEYSRLKTGNKTHESEELTVRILGPGCVSCNQIKIMLIDVMQEFGIAADIEQIQDLDEIWRYGVLNTPALIINNDIKSSGRLPSKSEIEQWLRDVLD